MGKEIKQTSQIRANNGAETLCLLKEAELPHQYWPTPLFAHPAPLSRPQNHEIALFFLSMCPFLCVVVTYLVLMLWRKQIGTGMAQLCFPSPPLPSGLFTCGFFSFSASHKICTVSVIETKRGSVYFQPVSALFSFSSRLALSAQVNTQRVTLPACW